MSVDSPVNAGTTRPTLGIQMELNALFPAGNWLVSLARLHADSRVFSLSLPLFREKVALAGGGAR